MFISFFGKKKKIDIPLVQTLRLSEGGKKVFLYEFGVNGLIQTAETK